VGHGGDRLVAAPGGQRPGELHINGVIDGTVELRLSDKVTFNANGVVTVDRDTFTCTWWVEELVGVSLGARVRVPAWRATRH
jgi:hypothetical protein